ncbi:MAG TPA: NAD(P)-binding domain-containing protein [Nocardioides sp.]|nr:NAD(P)-binding domain-containing protein [Nocardioides sp.]
MGLGAIGKPMAHRLAPHFDLQVADVDPGPVADLVSVGATAVDALGDLDVEVLCVMVRDDDQVREVLAEVQPGPVVLVHSTVAPGTPAELVEAGHTVLDAPVSGGTLGAADGTLAIMVGGPPPAYAAAQPVLRRLGSTVVHAGPLGAGTAMKLARNLIHFIALAGVTEAQRLAEAAGLDLIALGDVVRHSDAITGGPGAIMHRATAAPPSPDDAWYPILDHVRSLGEKDLSLAIGLADELGVDTPLAREALQRLAAGLGIASDQSAGA